MLQSFLRGRLVKFWAEKRDMWFFLWSLHQRWIKTHCTIEWADCNWCLLSFHGYRLSAFSLLVIGLVIRGMVCHCTSGPGGTWWTRKFTSWWNEIYSGGLNLVLDADGDGIQSGLGTWKSRWMIAKHTATLTLYNRLPWLPEHDVLFSAVFTSTKKAQQTVRKPMTTRGKRLAPIRHEPCLLHCQLTLRWLKPEEEKGEA